MVCRLKDACADGDIIPTLTSANNNINRSHFMSNSFYLRLISFNLLCGS